MEEIVADGYNDDHPSMHGIQRCVSLITDMVRQACDCGNDDSPEAREFESAQRELRTTLPDAPEFDAVDETTRAAEERLIGSLTHTWWAVSWPKHVSSPRFGSDADFAVVGDSLGLDLLEVCENHPAQGSTGHAAIGHSAGLREIVGNFLRSEIRECRAVFPNDREVRRRCIECEDALDVLDRMDRARLEEWGRQA